MHYHDLSQYEYFLEIVGSERRDYSKYLNVGWLDSRFFYPTGEVPAGFLDKLFLLCLEPEAETRGNHVCDLCKSPGIFEMLKVQKNGVDCWLGNGEIRIGTSEVVYVAPTLIYHYVSEHSYLPPAKFIEAVLES